jgi:transposase
MKKLYVVHLTAEEQTTLTDMLKTERLAARRRQRAQILLLAHDGRTDAEIAQILRCGTATVERTRRKFVEANLPGALTEQPRPGARRKLDGKAEAFLVATACSAAPAGRSVWTMQLLAERLVECGVTDTISDETVRRLLKKTRSSPG